MTTHLRVGDFSNLLSWIRNLFARGWPPAEDAGRSNQLRITLRWRASAQGIYDFMTTEAGARGQGQLGGVSIPDTGFNAEAGALDGSAFRHRPHGLEPRGREPDDEFMPLAAGRRLGPKILLPIGAGGMGEVYRASDTRLGRTVAIKVIRAQSSVSQEFQERFAREARAISALDHPHICALYDVGHDDGLDYLVIQYLEGETLAERLARLPQSLPLDETLRHARQIAEALGAAHRKNIVHRDLKPGNVMLTTSGIKLLDFGLAKLVPARRPARWRASRR